MGYGDCIFFVPCCLTIANFYIPVVFQDIVSFIDTVHGILFNYIHIPISHHIPPSPHEFAILQLIGSESDLCKGLKGEKANPVCRFSGQCFFLCFVLQVLGSISERFRISGLYHPNSFSFISMS